MSDVVTRNVVYALFWFMHQAYRMFQHRQAIVPVTVVSRYLFCWILVLNVGFFCQQQAFADNVPNRTFEMRTYTVRSDQLENLHRLIQDHSGRYFIKYGIQVIAIWQPQSALSPEGQLICLLAHPDRKKAEEAWEAFNSDPRWQQKVEAAGVDGKVLADATSRFFDPTHYSPMK